MTINEAISTIESAVANPTDETVAAAKEAAEFLNSKSRFTVGQKDRIKDVFEAYYEILEAHEEESPAKTMAEKLRRARERYVVGVSASGNKSAHTDDDLAAFLEAKPLEDVLALADEFTPLDKGTHADRYAHLNLGSRRMNAGNKIRAALRRGDLQFRTKGGQVVGLKTVE